MFKTQSFSIKPLFNEFVTKCAYIFVIMVHFIYLVHQKQSIYWIVFL